MPNETNNRRGRGRPALENHQALLRRFRDAYPGGLTISEIQTAFGWSEATVRVMISLIRSRYNVTIRSHVFGRSRIYDIAESSMPIANAALQALEPVSESPTETTPAPEQPIETVAAPVAAPDTRESIARLLASVRNYENWDWNAWLTQQTDGCRSNIEQLLRGRMFDEVRDRALAWVTAERARVDTRVDTQETITALLRTAPGFENWDPSAYLQNQTNPEISVDVNDLLVGSQFESIRDRVRAWIVAERTRRTVEPIEVIARLIVGCDPYASERTDNSVLWWVRWLTSRTTGERAYLPVDNFLIDYEYGPVRERVQNWITRARDMHARGLPIPSEHAQAAIADDLWRGIPLHVASYYRERALDLLS